MLAYIGHLRLDGWDIPPAHPFTLQLKRALEDEDDAALRTLPKNSPLPPSAGQVSPLSDDVFPKWWRVPEVQFADWKSFDLGQHICAHYAATFRQVCASACLESYHLNEVHTECCRLSSE